MSLKTIIADIETTALEHEGGVMLIPEKVHLLRAKESETGEKFSAVGHDAIRTLLHKLEDAETIVFHNALGFDMKVLSHHFGFKPKGTVLDSLVLSHMFHSNLSGKDSPDNARVAKDIELDKDDPFKFSGSLKGRHSLEAWGLRLDPKFPKGSYSEDMKAEGKDPWAEYNEEMDGYCEQDVELLDRLWKEKLEPQMIPSVQDAVNVEHYMAGLMDELNKDGIKFDVEAAEKLSEDLEKRAVELEAKIKEEFPPRLEPVKWNYTELPANVYSPLMHRFPDSKTYRPKFNLPAHYEREMWGAPTMYKVPQKVKDRVTKEILYEVAKHEQVDGSVYGNHSHTKVHWQDFNPGSRPQIVQRLLEFGWHPEEFTDAGNPSTDADTLTKLEEEFPAAKSIVAYLTVQKRLGQIKTGKKAWLNLVDKEGYIHPTIFPCNAVTHRATHADPNISQVPSVKMVKVPIPGTDKFELNAKGEPKLVVGWGEEGKWGADCRAFFIVPPGYKMVGSDLSGIELRCWCHYLWEFDDGELANIVLNQDVHENNRRILEFNDRRDAKSFLFALMYGAGDEKLGWIIEPLSSSTRQKAVGRQARVRFMSGVKGFNDLNKKMKIAARRGYLVGLDGRRLYVRKEHAALNTLLQSAGAIISKYWIINVIQLVEAELGLEYGRDKDYWLMIYSHDELQFAVREEHSVALADICVRASEEAGKYLGLKLSVGAESCIGNNWCETH